MESHPAFLAQVYAKTVRLESSVVELGTLSVCLAPSVLVLLDLRGPPLARPATRAASKTRMPPTAACVLWEGLGVERLVHAASAKLGNTPITKVQVLASSAGLELTQMTMPPNVSHALRENMAAQVRPLAVPCVPAENFRNIRLLHSVTPVVVALMR